MASVLTVQEVTRSFGSLRALDGVDWQVPDRGIHGLVGPNGAGKTTLYGVICGFLSADSGAISLAGQAVTTTAPPGLGVVGMLPQDGRMPEHLAVGMTLNHYGRLLGMTRTEARGETERVLDLVGLGDAFTKKPKTLSHGMFKRVAIAQAFLGKPELVLLDEPTAGLDPQSSREIRALLRGLRGERSIVVSSHNLSEVEDLCDTVAILDAGRVVRHDTVAEVVGEAASIDVRLVAPPSEALTAAIRGLSFVTSVVHDDAVDRLRVDFDTSRVQPVVAARDLVQVLAETGTNFIELQIGSSLEDRFLEETS
jgi:ABC-2 type transport system ATP-binding protein